MTTSLAISSNEALSFDLMPNFSQMLGPQAPEFNYALDDESDHIVNSATFRVPVSQGSVFTRDSIVQNNSQPFLDYSQQNVPQQLYDLQVGGSYFNPLQNGNVFGANLTIGSASDFPFWSLDETTVSATVNLYIPHDKQNSYLVLINYSDNRQFLNNIPIPGFIWFYTPDNLNHFIFGLPFAGYTHNWDSGLKFSIFYLIPASLKAQLVQPLNSWLKAFVAFDFRQELYILRSRVNSTDRLYYDEKRAFAGLTFQVCKSLALDVAGGYAFDRSFFEAQNYFKPEGDKTPLNGSAYGSFSLNARF